MKITFKNLIVIFLVALLGGAAGNYAFGALKTGNNKVYENLRIEEVSYSNKTEGVYEKAIAKAINTVVEITTTAEVTNSSFFGTYTQDATFLGSGVIISKDGYIVTNNHVVEGAKNVSVVVRSGETYTADIIGTDVNSDLALLKIDASNLQYASFLDSSELVLGKEVIAIGNAIGKGISSTNGIISALDREITLNNHSMSLIVTNAAVNSGNSGGGLFDLNGNIVGIVNAKTMYSSSSTVEGMGYAIPANTVVKIIEELKEYGYVKDRPTLGIKVYTNNTAIGYEGRGVVVSSVMENTPASKAGLKDNDIIKKIDGTEVDSYTELSKLLTSYSVGDEIALLIERDGKESEIKIILGENIKES